MARAPVHTVRLDRPDGLGPVVQAVIWDNDTVIYLAAGPEHAVSLFSVSAGGAVRHLAVAPLEGEISEARLCAGNRTAMLYVPGGRVYSVTPSGRSVLATEVETGAQEVAGLLSDGTSFHAVCTGKDGPAIAPMGADGLAGPLRPLPAEARGRACALLSPASEPGIRLLCVEDAGKGVQVFAQRGDGAWSVAVDDGFSRFAFNAQLNDAAVSEAGTFLAMSQGAVVRKRLFGMRNAADLVRVSSDGTYDVILGEIRATPTGLHQPLAGPEAVRYAGYSEMSRICWAGGSLYAALTDDSGMARIVRFGADWSPTELAREAGRPLALRPTARRKAPTLVMAG